MTGDDFAQVLQAAGEPAPDPRPPGWEADEMLSRMRERLAALTADRAMRHARHAARRRAARELYERTRRGHGIEALPAPLPWMSDDPPPVRVW